MIVFKWFLLRMLFGWIVRSWTVTCLGSGWFGRMLLRKLWLMLTGWLVDLSLVMGVGWVGTMLNFLWLDLVVLRCVVLDLDEPILVMVLKLICTEIAVLPP